MPFPTELPKSRLLPPMDAPSLRWGILGTGWIAEQFIRSVTANTQQKFTAVGSRSPRKARSFAKQWSIPTAYGSYEELVNDADLDVNYVATPHN